MARLLVGQRILTSEEYIMNTDSQTDTSHSQHNAPLALSEQAQTVLFDIKNLDCADCARNLEEAVRGLPGVISAHLVFAAATLTVQVRERGETLTSIERLAASMGHPLVERGRSVTESHSGWRIWLAEHPRDVTTAIGGLLLVAAFITQLAGAAEWSVRLLYSLSAIVSSVFIARAGWIGLRATRRPDMNVLMTVAAVGALVIGEVQEAALVMFLFAIGEMLEGYSAGRARHAIRALMELAPSEAILLTESAEARVPVASLQVGDRILVRPGERIPMDGQVLDGRSAVNQAPITGESTPLEKAPSDEVYAGSINGAGALTVRVSRLAEDNTLARIMRLVEEAQAQRAPTQRFVDRFAAVYTPIVLALAVLIAIAPPLLGLGSLETWVYRALVLLVIACPCALVISTPVTIVSALARGARAGVLIKGGRHLEELAAVRAVAFDKTGTLTLGRPQVVGGRCDLAPESPADCAQCQHLIARASAVEGRSEHALGRAVTEYAQALGVGDRFAAADDVTALAGMGIEGVVEGSKVTVGSHAYCHLNGRRAQGPFCDVIREAEGQGHTVVVIEDACCDSRCYLSIADTLREGAPEIIAALKQEGVEHIIMLTGDNQAVAESIARQAGISQVRAGLLPEDKVRAVEALQREYGSVAMVGDGVNDAPALAKASVGIAMGAAGTAAALETADVALMGDDLSRLAFAIRLGRRAVRVVRANIVVALLIKAVFLTLAVLGYSTLWMAVLADMGASLLVTFNGLRMLGMRDVPTMAGPRRA
jgi:Cd2+/Zn2+-exporting ATPase